MMVLKPTIVFDAASDIDAELLRRHGIRGLMVDLDDTLLASNEDRLPRPNVDWVRGLQSDGIAIVMLSNGEPARVARSADILGIQGFSLSGKPLPMAFRRGLAALALPSTAVAMVGDQLFTDVIGANLSGVTSILVRPLSPGKWLHTRLARRLERLVLGGGEHGSSIYR
jgi:HAD superfamily phosphatase (TIGR01668 family)